MRRRFIPRLECLEVRQVPDASPALPIPAPVLLTTPDHPEQRQIVPASSPTAGALPASAPALAGGQTGPAASPAGAPDDDPDTPPVPQTPPATPPPPLPTSGPADGTGAAAPLAKSTPAAKGGEGGSSRHEHAGTAASSPLDKPSPAADGPPAVLFVGAGSAPVSGQPAAPGGGPGAVLPSFRLLPGGGFNYGRPETGPFAPPALPSGGSSEAARLGDMTLALFGPGQLEKAFLPGAGDGSRGGPADSGPTSSANAAALDAGTATAFGAGLALVSPGLWGTVGRGGAAERLRQPADRQPGLEADRAAVPPVYLAVIPLSVRGKPLDPEAEGYRFLCGYARKSIRVAERRAGPLRDHEDIVHQICLEWLEKVGPPEEAFPKLLQRSPPEMQHLRETVNRVIARVIYQQRKRLLVTDFTDWPAPSRPAEQDWVEFKSDCERGVGSLTPREWHILELRRQGKTFAEIGSEIWMPKQRVWEIYHDVEARLQKIYRSEEG